MPARTKIMLGLGALLLAVVIISWVLKRESLIKARNESQSLNLGIAGSESRSGSNSSHPPRLSSLATDQNTAPAEPASSSNRVNVLAPFHVPNLTAVQAIAFVKENQWSAASLLAAFRTSQDSAYLVEAMQKFPNDPQVALEALFKAGLAPAERRPWLEALKKSAPDNPRAITFPRVITSTPVR